MITGNAFLETWSHIGISRILDTLSKCDSIVIMSDEIKSFIHESREHGKTDDEIRKELVASGWDEVTVDAAFQGGGQPAPAATDVSETGAEDSPTARMVGQPKVVKHVSPFGHYVAAWKYTFHLNGRATRKQFWWFVLFNVIFGMIAGGIDAAMGSTGPDGSGIIASLYALVILLPSLMLSIRRLHDTKRSGWWILIGVLPIIGQIVLLIFFLLPSYAGTTKYDDIT